MGPFAVPFNHAIGPIARIAILTATDSTYIHWIAAAWSSTPGPAGQISCPVSRHRAAIDAGRHSQHHVLSRSNLLRCAGPADAKSRNIIDGPFWLRECLRHQPGPLPKIRYNPDTDYASFRTWHFSKRDAGRSAARDQFDRGPGCARKSQPGRIEPCQPGPRDDAVSRKSADVARSVLVQYSGAGPTIQVILNGTSQIAFNALRLPIRTSSQAH